MIVILPNSETEKTLELYFIKNGYYICSHIVGVKANLSNIFKIISDVFFISNVSELDVDVDIDELKILNNWFKKHETRLLKLQLTNQTENDFCRELENIIRNFYNAPSV